MQLDRSLERFQNKLVLRPLSRYFWEFENAALFLWLRLPFTLIRHGNGAFRKRSSKRKNLKTLALRFSVDRNQFENGASSKRWHRNNRVTSLHEFTLKTYSNWPVYLLAAHADVLRLVTCSKPKNVCGRLIFRAFLNSFDVILTENICCVLNAFYL